MTETKALAEIAIDSKRGWVLPTFGSKKPFRYWAHVHFEDDITWGERTWTLLVDLDREPDINAGSVNATVYFLAPNAPVELLKTGAKFELVCGQSFYTTGVIKRLLG